MRLCVLVVLVALALGLTSGCTSNPYSFSNPDHWGRHVTAVYNDFHNLHKDIDRVLFGIYEEEDILEFDR